MENIDICLPYTENQEVLRLTTEGHCRAQKLKQDLKVIEKSRKAVKNAATLTLHAHAARHLFKLADGAEKEASLGEREELEATAREAYRDDFKIIQEAARNLDNQHRTGELYDRNQKKMVLVIGGGVSGLMTAWILLDKGYRVSIVAKEWANKAKPITSQIAGALWEYPPGGCGISEIEGSGLTHSKVEQYQKWAMQSFLFYKTMAEMDQTDSKFGARMITLYQFFHLDASKTANESPPTKARETAKKYYEKYENICNLDKFEAFKGMLQTSRKTTKAFETSEDVPNPDLDDEWNKAFEAVAHDKFQLKWGYRHQAPVIDSDKAMEFLMKLVMAKGAVLETREIKGDLHLQERELMDDFQADIIVNASGLGAKTLANDTQIFPVRGAVKRMSIPNGFHKDNAVLLPEQCDAAHRPSKTVFIVPRNEDTLVVGSILQRNNWDLSLTHHSPEVETMWTRATGCITHLHSSTGEEGQRPEDQCPLAQGLRPFSHSNVRVSADTRSQSSKVVHNYGHGGSGWTLAVGCAWTCVQLVEKMLHEGKSGSMANAEIWG